METTKQWVKEFEDFIKTIGDNEEELSIAFDVCENEQTAREIIEFIKRNNITCFDTPNNYSEYLKYEKLFNKCMLIARRENIGEFVDEEYARYLDEILAKEKAEKKMHEKGDK